MKVYHNVSAQKVSWVKSNKILLEANSAAIANLYYPESIEELVVLIDKLKVSGDTFELIGYSSNTLFLPSYHVNHLICIRDVSSWFETDSEIVCDCGVNVSKLSKEMIIKGYMGFEGLTDLPGTIAGAVYGNSGCRHCSINELVTDVELLTNDGVRHIGVDDLKPSYRSTALKRKEIYGTILKVKLKKTIGNPKILIEIANKNSEYRKIHQPSGANNLGTTINGGYRQTLKGHLLKLLERCIQFITANKDPRFSFPLLLKIIGKGYFSSYVYRWNRYMFLDAKAHELFPQYVKFIKSLYKDVKLEIELRR